MNKILTIMRGGIDRLVLMLGLVMALVVALVSCDAREAGNGGVSKRGGIFARKQVEHPGHFHYRLRASYVVKETGENLDFERSIQ